MAHCEKFTKASCGQMLSHYDRGKEHYGNENIDAARSHLNYNVAAQEQPLTQGEFLRQRCSQVYMLNRKDVNVMCDWVVTAPKDLPEKELKQFFQSAYDFMADRYGHDNVVSAYVHMDEVTPHMHFAFVPVVYDQKKDRYKISACEVINRTELKQFHPALQNHVEQSLGHEVGILNEATKEGNKTIAELKRLNASNELETLKGDINTLNEQKTALNADLRGLRKDILTADKVKHIPHAASKLNKDKVILAKTDFDALCKTAELAEELLTEIEPARRTNVKADKIIFAAENEADNIITAATNQAKSMHEQMRSAKLESTIRHIERVLNSDEQLSRDFDKAERALAQQSKRHIRTHEPKR